MQLKFRGVQGLFVVLVAAAALLGGAPKMLAQTVTGTILGTVKDSGGGAVAGTTVTVKNVDTGITRTAMTDASGGYNIVSVPAGTYDLTASAQGFKEVVRSGQSLTVGGTLRVDFTLEVGAIQQQVVVTGEAPQVNTSNATLSGLVNDTNIRELPLNGRDWLQLATIQTGVVQLYQASGSGATGAGVKMFISGGRSTENVFRVDGFVVNDYGNNSPGNALGINMGVDAIREFSVLRNSFSAEYGRSSGGVVNAILKSGTNQIHGSAFYFMRNSALDARNFFDGSVIPEFRRHQFGASIGGPIKKDKLFYFADYEGVRQFNPASYSTNTLSDDARNGLIVCDPTAITDGTCVLQTSGVYKKQYTVSSRVMPYLLVFPEPNVPGTGDSGLFVFGGGTPGLDNYVIGKVDYQLNANNLVNVSYNFDGAKTDTPDNYNDKKTISQSRTQTTIISWQHTFSATVLNTVRTGVNRIHAPNGLWYAPSISAISDTSLYFVPGHTFGSFSLPFLDRFSPGGLDTRNDTYNYTDPQVSDDLSWVKGRNNFRMGFSAEGYNDNVVSNRFPAGEWTFNSMVDFITATNPSQFNADFPGTDAYRSYREKMFGLYFLDDLRVTSNLTLNLGIRYEPDTVDKEQYGKASVIANLLTDGPNDPYRGNPIYDNNSLRNFEPRVGLAWDPFKDGKTSVRAGFGVYDVLLTPNLFTLRLNRSYPFYNQGIANSDTLANGIPGVVGSCSDGSCFPHGGLAYLSPTSKLSMYIEPKPPATYKLQWNLNIQRQITPGTSVTVGYVGARGVHLPVANNDIDYVPLSDVTYVNGHYTIAPNSQKFNTQWSRIQSMRFFGYAIYHALQISANKQMSHGVSFNGSYTFSKSIDNGGQEYTSNEFASSMDNPYPLITELQRGPSNFDVRHNMTVSFVWDIPSPGFQSGAARFLTAGWELTGIFSVRSGLPFNLGIPTDQAGTKGFRSTGVHVTQRPDFGPSAPGCNAATPQGAVTGNPDNYLNMSCFPYPAAGTLGDLGRDQLRAPGLRNFDFSVFKNHNLFGERMKVQFRAEFFNIFNHPNFQAQYVIPYNGSGAVTSSASTASFWFGKTVTSARQIQFGMKFLW